MSKDSKREYHRQWRQNRSPEKKTADRKKAGERRRAAIARNKAAGLCACGGELPDGYKTCVKCREKAKVATARNRALGRCYFCPQPAESGKTCCSFHLAKQRAAQQALRDEVIRAYGGWRCRCCGETIPEFLQIDHIDGKGAEHRKEVSGTQLYQWLRRNNFPPGFQVLCANCNFAKGHYGKCPHEPTDKEVDHARSSHEAVPG